MVLTAIGKRRAILVLLASLPWLAGCGAINRMAVRSVVDTLGSGSGGAFAREDDVELVADAAPFGLKLYESLLESVPDYVPALVLTCSGYTQYTFAIVQQRAEALEDTDFEEFTRQRDRALKLYLRARDYCLRGLDERFDGVRERLIKDPAAALTKAKRDDVDLLYWSAAAWGSALSLGLGRPELAGDLYIVRALAERALALDEDWGNGALHELMISLDSQNELVGGSLDRARKHFERAVEIQGGKQAGPYVSFASSVSVKNNDRAEFEKLLKHALTIDPDQDPDTRLANIVAQQKARRLLAKIDDIFLKGSRPSPSVLVAANHGETK